MIANLSLPFAKPTITQIEEKLKKNFPHIGGGRHVPESMKKNAGLLVANRDFDDKEKTFMTTLMGSEK